MRAKTLTETGGIVVTYLYDDPLIAYLGSGEQPEYVFRNETRGLAVTHPDGREEVLHDTGSEGKRYLLVTDRRILYVAGCKGGDEHRTVRYEQLEDAVVTDDRTVRLLARDGCEFEFVPIDKYDTDVERAVEYVSDEIASRDGDRESGLSPALLETLVARAESDTVTAERLGGTADGVELGASPLVEHLADDEQPHFVFDLDCVETTLADRAVDLVRSGMQAAVVVTDTRVVVVGETGDEALSVALSGVAGGVLDMTTEFGTGDVSRSNALTLSVSSDALTSDSLDAGGVSDSDGVVELRLDVALSTGSSRADLENALEYVAEHAGE